MPPRIKITREEIVRAALELVRRDGAEAVNARQLAKALNCSTQPIFSNFSSMEELKLAVVTAADALYQAYTKREIESDQYPVYKAAGMAYIRFAREERELFKLLFMRDRSDEVIPEETEDTRAIAGIVQATTGFAGDRAKLFHLEMWAYVHGIAAMMATGFLELDADLVSEMMTDAYQGLRKRYEEKE